MRHLPAALGALLMLAASATADPRDGLVAELSLHYPAPVRAAAWRSLHAAGDDALPLLRRAARTAPERSVRAECVRLLATLGDRQSVPFLLDRLAAAADTDDAHGLLALSWSLGRIGDRRATAALVALATAPHAVEAARRGAAVGLGLLGDDAAAPVLGDLLGDPSREVRVLAAGSLGLLGSDAGLATALAAAATGTPAQRYLAVEALGLIGGPAAVAALAEVVAGSAPRAVRRAATESLARIGAAAASARLASTSSDPAPAKWGNDVVHPGLTRRGIVLAGAPELLARCWSCSASGAPAPQCAFVDEGSVKEDYSGAGGSWNETLWGDDSCGQDPTGTWFNHSYNPYTGAGWYDLGGLNALDYAVPLWDEAVAAYRAGDFDAAYFLLGRVCHLVEDATAPAHANADVHATGDDAESWAEPAFPDLAASESTPRRPSTQTEYPGLTGDTFTNFMLNVAWRTYHASTFQAVLVEELGGGVQPDSELERMFPGLEYLDDWYYPDYWWIPEVGDCYNGVDPFGSSEWWLAEGDYGDGSGYFYLENIDDDDDGSCASGCVAPAVRRVDVVSRPAYLGPSAQGPYLDQVLTASSEPLVATYAATLFPLAAEWIAGLTTFFGEVAPSSAQPPWAPTALSAVALAPSTVELSWVDGSGNETSFLVERQTVGSTGWTTVASVAADTTATVDAAASPATAYAYRVRATNGAGTSAASQASVTTPAAAAIFADGFDSGDLTAWASTEP